MQQQPTVKPYVLIPIIILSMVLACGAFLTLMYLQRNTEQVYSEELQQRLNQLEGTKKNMEEIIQFIEEQQASIVVQETELNKLKQEAEILKIAKEGDENTVFAVLDAYEVYNQREIWKERFIGYFVGVFSSLTATFIVFYWNRLRNRN